MPSSELSRCRISSQDSAESENFRTNLSKSVRIRATWELAWEFSTFYELVDQIEAEYENELTSRIVGTRDRFDPFVYDLYHATQMILEDREFVEDEVRILVSDTDNLANTRSWNVSDETMFTYATLSEGNTLDHLSVALSYEYSRPKRFDRCACEHSLRCPNGTISQINMGSIYDCVKGGVEVLLRKSMIPTNATWKSWDISLDLPGDRIEEIYLNEYSKVPESHVGLPVWPEHPKKVIKYNFDGTLYDQYIVYSVLDAQLNTDGEIGNSHPLVEQTDTSSSSDSDSTENNNGYVDIRGDGLPLESLQLKGWEVAVITIDLRNIPANYTYDKHYRIAVYVDCAPCPTRYVCNYANEPPTCDYPPYSSQLESGVFCSDYEHDNGKITNGCCQCESKQMPYFFQNEPEKCNIEESPSKCIPFMDNKHSVLQFSITALRDVKVTVAFELMHGLHYGSYLEDIKNEIFDVKLFMPNRTSSSTNEFLRRRENAEYSSFVSIITKDIFDDLEMRLPMNLPMEMKRKRYKTDEFEMVFAHDILIDRIGNMSLGDRDYAVRQQDVRHIVETYGVNNSMDMSDRWTPVDMRSLPHGLTATEFYNADGNRVGQNHEIETNTNYIVQDPKSLVFMENTWWQTSENSIYTSFDYTFDFLGLHYLPFFSSCEGYGSHIHIAKLLEDNYMCNYVASTDLTIPVEQFGVLDSNAPFGDSCISKYEDPFNFDAETVMGIEMQCLYEEDVFSVVDGFRWYEMAGGTDDGTTLFYLSKYPVMFKDFRGEKNTQDCDETNGYLWPRGCSSGEIDPWNVHWGRTFKNENSNEENEKVGSFGGVGIYPRIVSNHIVPVVTASDVALKSQRRIPRKVRLEMQYFQVSKTKRSMVASNLVFQDPCTTYETIAKLKDEAKLNNPPICPCRRTVRLEELQRAGMIPEECAESYVVWERRERDKRVIYFFFSPFFYFNYFTQSITLTFYSLLATPDFPNSPKGRR